MASVELDPTFSAWTKLAINPNSLDGSAAFLLIPMTWLSAPLMCSGGILFAIIMLNLLIREKDAKLLDAMRRIGLIEWAHICSWFLAILIASLSKPNTLILSSCSHPNTVDFDNSAACLNEANDPFYVPV